MTTFQSSTKGLRIYPTQLGRTIEFSGGRYETDDPAEVQVLRSHPLVSEKLAKLSRRELDARAAAAGVDAPTELPNKQAVVDALEGDHE